MQTSRRRLICASHNPFTPSIALWQHFVLPNRTFLRQQLLSSSTVPAVDPNAPSQSSSPETPLGASPPLSPQNAEASQTPQTSSRPQDVLPTPIFRKVKFRSATQGVPAGSENATQENLHDFARSAFQTPSGSKRQTSQRSAKQKPRGQSEDAKSIMAQTKRNFDQNQDYTGQIVMPIEGPNKDRVREYRLPWCVPRDTAMSGSDRLAHEIRSFYEYAKPSRGEELARQHLIEQIKCHTREIIPDAVLEVFGSERTGLAFATSDIDLRLVNAEEVENPENALRPPTKQERLRLIDDLHRLHLKLQKNDAYLLCLLRYARYPLITMQDRASGLDIQIVLSNDTSLSRSIMQKYMEEYPYLREVYTVVKTILDIRGLSDVFRGGFGSYSIFMMIVAALKHRKPAKPNAGTALKSVLSFWATFDTYNYGISIEPTRFFKKGSKLVMSNPTKSKLFGPNAKPQPQYLLCLEDPADDTNDLGRKGICIKHVQTTFKKLYQQLSDAVSTNTRHSLLYPLVGPVYALNLSRRKKLEAHGRHALSQKWSLLAAEAQEIREGGNGTAEKVPETQVSEGKVQPTVTVNQNVEQDHGDVFSNIFGMPSAEEMAKDEQRESQVTLSDANESESWVEKADSTEAESQADVMNFAKVENQPEVSKPGESESQTEREGECQAEMPKRY